jgi:DNA-binding CsgD family transcriptional regulator
MEKPSDSTDGLTRGREAFERHQWTDAYAKLSAVETALGHEDLERLAMAAYLVGRYDASIDVWTRAHHECLRLGDTTRAARCVFWMAFGLLEKRDVARAAGWLARGRHLLDDGKRDCVERGYLLLPGALQKMAQGDAAAAYGDFEDAATIGDRFLDPDLRALGQLGRGQALTQLGETARGVALFDEAMAAVTCGEVSPIVAGIIYCCVLEACMEVFDLGRAREWTAAMSRWCASQPDLVPYRGHCLVHRAEIMQLRGAWPDAMGEAEQACERLSGEPTVGGAFYRQAEIHRLRGEFANAEEAYREASRCGREPWPGLALLRLAQGQVDAAEAAIRRAVDEARDRATMPTQPVNPYWRSATLPDELASFIEIMLSAGDVPAARAAVDELSAIAATRGAPFLHALSAHATGAVLLAEGNAPAALGTLRRAWAEWYALEAPYHAARVRVLIALVCRTLGDADSAEVELDAARQIFQQLGARPDLRRLEVLSARRAELDTLSPREVEVLRLVAAGKSNHAIATELVISGHTVRRHLQNIFAKLNVSSRTAAAAFAFERGLI